jgi:hypothetical protein
LPASRGRSLLNRTWPWILSRPAAAIIFFPAPSIPAQSLKINTAFLGPFLPAAPDQVLIAQKTFIALAGKNDFGNHPDRICKVVLSLRKCSDCTRSSSTADIDPRLFRRRRLGEAPIEAPTGPMSILQGHRAWDAYEKRLKMAGLPIPENPYRFFDRS